MPSDSVHLTDEIHYDSKPWAMGKTYCGLYVGKKWLADYESVVTCKRCRASKRFGKGENSQQTKVGH